MMRPKLAEILGRIEARLAESGKSADRSAPSARLYPRTWCTSRCRSAPPYSPTVPRRASARIYHYSKMPCAARGRRADRVYESKIHDHYVLCNRGAS